MGVVRAMIKVNGEGQTLTPTTPKPLNRSSPKFAQVITLGIPTTCKILFRSDNGFHFHACVTSRTNVYSAIFWGVLTITYSQDATTDINAKYVKRRGSAQGCAF